MANGHGGRRPGAGRKKKPLAEKILEDSTRKHRPKVLNMNSDADAPPEPPEWIGYYGSKTAGSPDAPEIHRMTVAWLRKTGCLHLINPEYITDYAIIKANWYEAQRLLTRFGMVHLVGENKLGTIPTVDAALKLYKMAEIAWSKIWMIVAQNCEADFGGKNPHDDLMEHLIDINREG